MQRAFVPILWAGPFALGAALVTLAGTQQGRSPGRGVQARPNLEPPERLQVGEIENVYRLSPRLYSGGDPHGKKSLEALGKLGIKTIISVDGVAPDVETAKGLGIRYVHLPVGYDGIPREQAVRMVRAVKTLPGPFYVHCHHGIHRGPTAAAICGMATEGWSKERAVAWMERAGASPDYRGLYTSARGFVPPTAKELEKAGGELPERSEVPVLAKMMVKVDERWDRMKAIQKAGFKSPPDRPGPEPTAEALQLLELFRESSRLPEVKERGEGFAKEMASAEGLAEKLYEATTRHGTEGSPESLKGLEAAFAAAGKSCKACHARHRDN